METLAHLAVPAAFVGRVFMVLLAAYVVKLNHSRVRGKISSETFHSSMLVIIAAMLAILSILMLPPK